ncbi:hypothetical protein, partial [Halalkalibacterium ligniniphilum]
ADTGVLPIKTRDANTVVYQRYPVDFNQLVPRYIQQPPGNSFENGGVFQYVLVNVDKAPEIKLIDLRPLEEIQRLQQRLNQYMREHTYAPVDEILDVGLFTLDYEALNYREAPLVPSPYHDTYLPLLLTNGGDIVIDYRTDLNILLQESDVEVEPGEDIRDLLVERSPFVPAFSIPYSINEQGEPVYDMSLPNVYENNE